MSFCVNFKPSVCKQSKLSSSTSLFLFVSLSILEYSKTTNTPNSESLQTTINDRKLMITYTLDCLGHSKVPSTIFQELTLAKILYQIQFVLRACIISLPHDYFKTNLFLGALMISNRKSFLSTAVERVKVHQFDQKTLL